MSLLDAYAKTVVDQADKIKAQADEIERLREALRKIDLATSVYALKNIPEVVSQLVRSALQQKETT